MDTFDNLSYRQYLSLDRKKCGEIAADTIDRSAAITAEHAHEGATLDSRFVMLDDLPALKPEESPGHPPVTVRVVNLDSFTAARELMDADPEGSRGKTCVLNLASDAVRAGGWVRSLTKTQEEALCYSSTLYETLKPSYYPWPNLGPGSAVGVYSPGIVIFKDDLDHGCAELPVSERRVVSVATVAAPRWPKLTLDRTGFAKEEDLRDLRDKIRLTYRMAARHEQAYLVLGAMGCGVYACPPRLVAQEMKAMLQDSEFKGWFQQIVFAVYSKPDNGGPNYNIFKEVFDGVVI